jgi:hypothetical protein
MSREHHAHDQELEDVAQRLRDERPEASPLDLDRIKTIAMSRAKAARRKAAQRKGAGARRFAVAGLTVGLMAAGTGGVIAGVGSGRSHGNAATAQYGGNCDTNNGNGDNIGSGNGNKDGNGNGNTAFVAHIAGKSHKGGGGVGNGSGNGNENGNGNGVGDGNENGNESGNGNNNFNCNENSFNDTENNVTNNITNNYYTTTTATVSAAPAAGVLGATASKKVSSRLIKIHINLPRKSKLRKVTLRVNGKIVSVLRGKRASANIKLVDVPCSAGGATKVTITAVTSSGRTITQSHTYHLC